MVRVVEFWGKRVGNKRSNGKEQIMKSLAGDGKDFDFYIKYHGKSLQFFWVGQVTLSDIF